jgi:hypothetical protein
VGEKALAPSRFWQAWTILSVLGTVLGGVRSLTALSALSDDEDPLLSARAACALLSRPDSRSRPFLLRSNRGDLTSETAQALGRINAQERAPFETPELSLNPAGPGSPRMRVRSRA